MKQIQKRDGRVVEFQYSKIYTAIERATKTSKEEVDIAKVCDKVIEQVDHIYWLQTPTVEGVQDIVIEVLKKEGYVKTSTLYEGYRAKRTKIRTLKMGLMKEINDITFSDNNDIKRENANIDGNTAMGTMLQYGSSVSKFFCKSTILSDEFSDAHDDGLIHIHDLDFMNMGTLTCCQINLEQLFKGGFSTGHGFLREPNDISSYAALAAIAIQSNQNDQHGGQSIPAFDYYLAPGVVKTFKKLYRSNFEKAKELLNIDVELDDSKIDLDKNIAYQDEQSQKVADFAFARAKEEVDQKTFQAMEAFIHNLNTMHSRAGAQVPFSSINFGTDISTAGRLVSKNLLLAQEAGLGNGETPIFPILIFKVKEGINYNESDPNYDLFELSCRVSSKRLFPNFSFIDAPFNLQYYDPKEKHTEIAYMGCRTRVIGNVCGENTVEGRGNTSFTSINLVRLGIEYGKISGKYDKVAFFAKLNDTIDLVIKQLLERFEMQGKKRVKNFPFLMGQKIWKAAKNLNWNDTLEEVIKQGTLSVGFIGLAECLKALIGTHHGESEEAQKLGLEIIQFMNDKMQDAKHHYKLNFSLIATPAEGLSGRFTRIDRKRYGVLDGITDKDYYTNSFHIPVYYAISIADKIALEAPYHALTDAGHISYVEVDGDLTQNLEAFKSIVRCMKENGIGYGSINHPIDRDPVCGYSGIIQDICPNCNREEGDVPFDRIRRITGYLVGTLDRFNNGKKAEEKDRIKHG